MQTNNVVVYARHYIYRYAMSFTFILRVFNCLPYPRDVGESYERNMVGNTPNQLSHYLILQIYKFGFKFLDLILDVGFQF